METAKHTPGPTQVWPTHWAGGWGPNASFPNRIRIQQLNGPQIIAYIEHHGTGSGQDKYPTEKDYATARRIQLAYDSHDALVDALKESRNLLIDLIYEEPENALDSNRCFECKAKAGEPHDEECYCGRVLTQNETALRSVGVLPQDDDQTNGK